MSNNDSNNNDNSNNDLESQFLKQFFLLRTNVLDAGMQFIDQVRDVIAPFRILRDEGKEFFSLMDLEEENAEEAFEEYKTRLLKRFGVTEAGITEKDITEK